MPVINFFNVRGKDDKNVRILIEDCWKHAMYINRLNLSSFDFQHI